MKIRVQNQQCISSSAIVTLLLFSITGCGHCCISGTVVNEHGEPVPFANVVVCGMRGGMLTGEKPVASQGTADSNGRFNIKASSAIFLGASSPDKKYTADLVVPVKGKGNIIVLKKDSSEE